MGTNTSMERSAEEKIREAVFAAKEAFGVKCHKYTGALTVEFLRSAFAQYGIPTSHRDVFIKGVPVEIDIIIPKIAAVPAHGICYEADDVLAAIEVKSSGTFNKTTGENLRSCFNQIRGRSPSIWCAYVTLMERENFIHKITSDNLGFPAYTLFWHTESKRNPQYAATGDWTGLITELQKLTEEK